MTTGLSKYPMNENIRELSNVIAINWVEYSFASSILLAPTSCDNMDVPAIDNPMPKDTNKKFTGNTKAVAAKWTDDSLLTHTPSTKLYNVCIRLFIIMGIDSVKRAL